MPKDPTIFRPSKKYSVCRTLYYHLSGTPNATDFSTLLSLPDGLISDLYRKYVECTDCPFLKDCQSEHTKYHVDSCEDYTQKIQKEGK